MINKFKKYLVKRRVASDLVRMYSGETSLDEQNRIANWRNNSDSYQQEFIEANTLLADLGGLQKNEEMLAVVDKSNYNQQIATIIESPSLKYTTSYARLKLSLVASIFMVFSWFAYQIWFVPESINIGISRYMTQIGEQKQIELSDGSKITLNTGTSILVEMTQTQRKIMLERGEAFFDVAKDPNRPFAVQLQQLTVTALGTKFNIKATPKEFVLALVEGVVALHSYDEPVIADAVFLPASGEGVIHDIQKQHRVKAGTLVRYKHKAAKLMSFTEAQINQFQSWRSGILRFDSVPLKTLIQELNRYSNKKILIEDVDVMSLKVYATVRVDRLDLALNDLEKTLPIDVLHYFDRIVIKKPEQK